MPYEEKKAQLSGWLGQFSPHDPLGVCFRFTEKEDGRGSLIFCTAAHTYHLSFADDYLGAQACTRTYRAGEDWCRGNDLPDGKFTRETFDNIIRAVFAYELVALAPVVEPVAATPAVPA